MPIPLIMRTVKGLNCDVKKNKQSFWSSFVYWFTEYKSRAIIDRIQPYLGSGKILDVGMGSGTTACLLKRKGYKVDGIDVVNLSMYEDISPKIYNGTEMPYRDKAFDQAIIIHALHHCNEPLTVLTEAIRVAKRVIFIEDTYRNYLEKMVGSACDALGNFEFRRHKYESVANWKNIIMKHGWKVVRKEEWSETFPHNFFYGRYCMFVIE